MDRNPKLANSCLQWIVLIINIHENPKVTNIRTYITATVLDA